MRVSLSWLREYVDLPAELDPAELDAALVRLGLEVEELVDLGTLVTGPLLVGRVEQIEELTEFKKPIRYCQVDIGEGQPRGIVCGARNFAEGDLVVVAVPGTVLPGDFAIAARKTYGRVSDGMICSSRELGVGDDHAGIIVLPPGTASPGDQARPLVGLDDVLVEVNITPDRGYCFSLRGIARELSHAFGVSYRDPAHATPALPADGTPAYPVRVEDPAGCDRFAAVAVRGIDPAAPSPAWLRSRLATAGVRSISLVVDVTNYVMLELGQPMHAFDLAALRGDLVVRRANPGEELSTLDGTRRRLRTDDLVIADNRGAISLAAVMGGASTEVSDATVDVLLEAAHWDPATIARTARLHKLPSEASKRFERGVDRELVRAALARAVELLTRHAGGEVSAGVTDVDAGAERVVITLAAGAPSRVSGVGYPPERVAELLEVVGCAVHAVGDQLQVTPPSWRPDLTDPADLVEEVVRLDGYDKVPSELPFAPPGNGLTAAQRRRRSVGRALAESGYVEVLSYPFVGEAALAKLGIPAEDSRRRQLRLVNPISEEEPALRTTLLPPLLATLRRNLGRGLRDVALYEVGSVFHPASGTGQTPALGVDARPAAADLAAAERLVPDQPWHVAVVLAGEQDPTSWWGRGRPADWADAVEAARTVAAVSGVTLDVRSAAHPPWHPGRCASLSVGGQVVGYAGELHPAVCAAYDLPKRTSAAELNLDALPLPGVVDGPRISSFPPAMIDVALVVGRDTPAGEVERALTEGAGALLESVRLFDVYAGEQLGHGQKSLAYKLTFRAPDRTLTVEEAVAARDAAVAVAATRAGAVLRGA